MKYVSEGIGLLISKLCHLVTRTITVLFTLLVSLVGYGQTYFESPVTQNLTTQQIEQIERTITIGDKFVVLETIIDETSNDIQQLKIKETSKNLDNFGSNNTYHCTSYDGLYPTPIIVYLGEKVNATSCPTYFIGNVMSVIDFLLIKWGSIIKLNVFK